MIDLFRWWWRPIRIASALTAIVALGSAVLSWDALRWGAGQLGVDPDLTWLFPVVIDGTIGTGTVAALVLQEKRRRVSAYVWALLVGFIGASVVGNAAHAAAGSWLHVAGAALPAVALASSLHLLVILVRETRPQEAIQERSRDRSSGAPGPRPPSGRRRAPAAERVRVLQLEAQQNGERLTGERVARALKVSPSYARKLLARQRERAGPISA